MCVWPCVCVCFRMCAHMTGHFSSGHFGDGTDTHFGLFHPSLRWKFWISSRAILPSITSGWAVTSLGSFCFSYNQLIPHKLKLQGDKQQSIHLSWVFCNFFLYLPSTLSSPSPSSLSCSMPLLHWDWYNIFQPQLAESLLTNSNCFCTWEWAGSPGWKNWGWGTGAWV